MTFFTKDWLEERIKTMEALASQMRDELLRVQGAQGVFQEQLEMLKEEEAREATGDQDPFEGAPDINEIIPGLENAELVPVGEDY